MSPSLKVMRFVGGDPSPSLDASLRSQWERALASDGIDHPGRPRRVAIGAPLTEAGFPPSPYAAVDVQWFTDKDAVRRNDAWLVSAGLGTDTLPDGTGVFVAEELVLRGEDYLAQRWKAGGEGYKMMSTSRRNPRLTIEEFSAGWRSQAGKLGDETIPPEAQGLAYAQNHPVPLDERTWIVDAVNDVYFELLEHLAYRRDYFAAREEAVKQSVTETSIFAVEGRWSMFVRERLLTPPET
jgi:hypothetical protein